jgi:hypothetical protein
MLAALHRMGPPASDAFQSPAWPILLSRPKSTV